MLRIVAILFFVIVAVRHIGLAVGYFVKVPVTYSRLERFGWAFICGIIPIAIGLSRGGSRGGFFLLLGVVIAVVVYLRPAYRVRRRGAK